MKDTDNKIQRGKTHGLEDIIPTTDRSLTSQPVILDSLPLRMW